MKIKTITCHDVYNLGASLQAYALMKYLQNLDHDVEIIDYKPDYLSNHYKLFVIANPKYDKFLIRDLYFVAKLPSRLIALFGTRKKQFDSFKEQYLKITQTSYSCAEELMAKMPEADVYFAGSDQIWNTLFNNGKDSCFYLDFVPDDKIKASYAASFATETILPEWQEQVKEWIKKLDFVSVRETSGLDILNSLGINKASVVLDPVFLLSKDNWKSIIIKLNLKNKYILIYDFDNSELVKSIALKISYEKKLKIYSMLKCEYADKSFEQMGPIDFLALIENAEYIVSNSFHATAFSIIFEKQFYVINRNEGINTRMRDLLSSLDISNRIINDRKQINYELINFSKVSIKLNNLIKISENYIDKVLDKDANLM